MSVNKNLPLAEAMRPTSINEIFGQNHLLGKGMPIEVMICSGKFQSMILYGPAGCGKTTLARVLCASDNASFITFSAVFSGVKEIRDAVLSAKSEHQNGKRIFLFIDEIHRFNKSQQDTLLPFVEDGTFVLIGATTENPSFEINQALLSRVRVFVLRTLDHESLLQIIKRVWTKKPLPQEVIDYLIQYADGDGRRLISALEAMVNVPDVTLISITTVAQLLSKQPSKFDKRGNVFYDQISALHKSVRGSHPDAALYWLCRMLDSGVDVHFIARRIIRMSWEDVGLADPRAITIALEAAQTYERLGSPEGELALGIAVVYLSLASKSNAGYYAMLEAQEYVKNHSSFEVPLHLRNAPTTLAKEMGHSSGYRYAHDYPNGFEPEQVYFPKDDQEWYHPKNHGFEAKIAEKIKYFREERKKFSN
ncbi:MAG: replication-associated recombination protein A [Methylacidiphilales bacterium]|nr:replication-associated recombination protein A [Candidatus Methylacidiphilales bacterium]